MRLSFACLITLFCQLESVTGLAGNTAPSVTHGMDAARTTSLTDRRTLLTGLLASATAATTLGWLGQKPAFAVESPTSSISIAESGDLQDVYFGVGCFWYVHK